MARRVRVRAPIEYPDFPPWNFDHENLRKCCWYEGIQVVIDVYPLCFHPSRYQGEEEIDVLTLLCAPDRCPLSDEEKKRLAKGGRITRVYKSGQESRKNKTVKEIVRETVREKDMYSLAIFHTHHFKGERIKLSSEEASRRYPFWKQLPKVDIDPFKLSSIVEIRFYDEMLDEIPEDLDRSTSEVGGRFDRVFLAFKDGHIEELPIRTTKVRIYRVRLSSYDDDVPNDYFIQGRSLRETFESNSIPWQEASFILWHSQGMYVGPIGPAWGDMLSYDEILQVYKPVVVGGSLKYHSGSRKWNNLEIIPI